MPLYYEISESTKIELLEWSDSGLFSADKSIDELSSYLKIIYGSDNIFHSKYYNMIRCLGINGKDIISTLPKYVVRRHLGDIKLKLKEALDNRDNAGYLKNFLDIKKFLRNLTLPSFDYKALRSLIDLQKHDGQKNNLELFNSNPPVKTVYSNSNTVTGRLTVTSGPNILTAPSNVRRCLKSSFPDGKILQIDLIAAEPKFALHFCGSSIPVDVYDDISNKIFSGKLKRHQVKIATICALYGQSPAKLSKQLPLGFSANSAISSVKDYFGYRKIIKHLSLQHELGIVKNHFNRPIQVKGSSPVVSYFLQSSIAEGSILMFSDFCRKFPEVKPIYVIHDALIVDVPLSTYSRLIEKDNIVDLYLGDWKFESKITLMENG